MDETKAEQALKHDDYRIALYYCYVNIEDVDSHISFHHQICTFLNLAGRVRVAPEGINGVLSGNASNVEEYEHILRIELESLQPNTDSWELDVKFCKLREELPVVPQLFDSLSVKPTNQVVSLVDLEGSSKSAATKRGRKSQTADSDEEKSDYKLAQQLFQRSLDTLDDAKAPHLSPDQWNARLAELSKSQENKIVLLDCRNVYESNVGYFSTPNATTVLTNTRKFSELPQVMMQEADRLSSSSHIFMYCTGGVRCERAGQFLHTVLEERGESVPQIYQLHGGIQRYLESDDTRFYHGKNFVFDPRRVDPSCTEETVGQCLVCDKPHDDYDNGHAPAENKEARCFKCRILILVCADCRESVVCWGDKISESKKQLFCGGLEKGCLHMPPVRVIET